MYCQMFIQYACHVVFCSEEEATFYPCFFLSNSRPYRLGDRSGLWRERSVPDLCRNGQKSQILQFVEKG